MRRRLALSASPRLLSLSSHSSFPWASGPAAGRRSGSARAERTAQSTAALLALTVSLNEDAAAIEAALGPLDPGTIVVLPDGFPLGEPMTGQGSLVAPSIERQATISGVVEVAGNTPFPSSGERGTAVVDIFVTDEALTEGVAAAWLLLALLGVLLVAIAVWVADRLVSAWSSRSVIWPRPPRQLVRGISTPEEVSDPEEIREVGESFNWLAGRLEDLIADEREAAADLSHRLRTPLTSLRLQAEKLTDDDERAGVLGQVDRLEQAIDQVIVATRSASGEVGVGDLSSVVSARRSFWAVLAEEQRREMSMSVDDHGAVPLSHEAVDAVVDALIGNVLPIPSRARLSMCQLAPNVAAHGSRSATKGPGSSRDDWRREVLAGPARPGSGLDIVRRTAESVGGEMEMNDRPGGGAVVRVWLGPPAG